MAEKTYYIIVGFYHGIPHFLHNDHIFYWDFNYISKACSLKVFKKKGFAERRLKKIDNDLITDLRVVPVKEGQSFRDAVKIEYSKLKKAE